MAGSYVHCSPEYLAAVIKEAARLFYAYDAGSKLKPKEFIGSEVRDMAHKLAALAELIEPNEGE